MNSPTKIVKRDGTTVDFNRGKITEALKKCFASLDHNTSITAEEVSMRVCNLAYAKFSLGNKIPTVENIQDTVEWVLQSEGEYDAAKHYILYREDRARVRETRPIPSDVREAFRQDEAYFPTPIQAFQFYDKYSRFNYDLGRRETWVETVDRTVDFLHELARPYADLGSETYEEIRQAILNMRIMPSMRLLAMAGPAARRDNTTIYNCFSGDTGFVTDKGIVSLISSVGKEVNVLTKDGTFKPASVRSFGVQKLNKVSLKHWNGGKSGNLKHFVYVTSNHRWFLANGGETTNIKVGDKLYSQNILSSIDVDIEGIRHGIIYGDGTITRNNGNEYAQIRLCGAKASLLEYFEGFNISYPESYYGDPVVYCGKENIHWKKIPVNLDSAYVAGFIKGLMLTDGSVRSSGNIRIDTQNAELVEWLMNNAASAGYKILAHRIYDTDTNFGKRSSPLNQVLLGCGEAAIFKVEEIEETEIEEEVYCVVEPVTKSFTLENGQVTGNCSFVPVDSLESFVEGLFISMAGCGVGFSVEDTEVNKIPVIKRQTGRTPSNYLVEDSAEGWGQALRHGLNVWFNGNDCSFDTSMVRPAGSILRIKGGRASGSEPLEKLLAFARKRILARQGRRLRPIDAHDIMCAVGSAAVAGGVRRTAMISLFDEDDVEMLKSKSGDLELNQQRWNANNSVVWKTSTQIEFMSFFSEMVRGERGEPGIFSRDAARAMMPARRDKNYEFGTNPCFAAGTLIHTKEGHFPIESLVGKTVDIWNGNDWQTVDNFRVTANNQPMLKITLRDGTEIRATEYHKFLVDYTIGGMKLAKDLIVGTQLTLANTPISHGNVVETAAYLKGILLAEGTQNNGIPILRLYEPKFVCQDRILQSAKELTVEEVNTSAREDLEFVVDSAGRLNLRGLACRKNQLIDWVVEARNRIPKRIFEGDLKSKVEFIAGYFDGDGSAQDSPRNGFRYQVSSINKEMLLDIQLLLKTIGVNSHFSIMKYAKTVDFNDGYGEYEAKDCWRLTISQVDSIKLAKLVNFSRLVSFKDKEQKNNYPYKGNEIVSIKADGIDDKVYCCTVENTGKFAITAGILSLNCGEIVLRPRQFCNLSAVINREGDTYDVLTNKARLATIVGTIQSLATYFPNLSSTWRNNCEEERLLGVDITGQQDNPGELKHNFNVLQATVIRTNREFAQKLGINQSTATTCVKPSGNTSVLVDCSSGLHARWAPYYIKNARLSIDSPLYKVMRDAGVPMAPENGGDNRTMVVSFPIKSPDGAITRNDRTVIEQLDWWLLNKEQWTEHNPSVTITYKPDEVLKMMNWVWDHLDKIGGMAFLPSFDAKYDQLPYIEITKEEYEERLATFPQIDWAKIYQYEIDDQTKAAQELACTSGVCSVDEVQI